MSLALGRRLIDKNNCKTLEELIDVLNDFHDALGNPINNPGPGPDGTVPPLYEPVYLDGDGNLTGGTVLTTVKIVGGLTTGAVAGTDPTFSIDTIVSLTDGFAAPAEPLTVANTLPIACGNNTAVYAIWNPTAEQWETWADTTGTSGTYFAGHGLELVTNTFSMYDASYSGTGYEIYISEAGTFAWREIKVALEYLGDYDDSSNATQVVGHEESGDVKFYGMATLATGLAQGDVACTSATFTGDGFTVLCGASISATETVQNPYGHGVDDNEEIVVAKKHDADTWYLLQSAPESVVLGVAGADVDDADATFDITTLTPLFGVPPTGEGVTVTNGWEEECAIGDPVLAIRYPGTTEWRPVKMKGVELEVISELTSLVVSETALTLNYKKARIRVPAITVDISDEYINVGVTVC